MSPRGGKRANQTGRPRGSKTERTELMQVRCTPTELERWRAAADREGMPDLSTWVRRVLDRAETATWFELLDHGHDER